MRELMGEDEAILSLSNRETAVIIMHPLGFEIRSPGAEKRRCAEKKRWIPIPVSVTGGGGGNGDGDGDGLAFIYIGVIYFLAR